MDALLGPAGYFGIAAAHRRGLFELLNGKRLTAAEIAEALELRPRPVNALLATATSLGLLDLSDERYALTDQAEDYLLPASPTYLGSFFDLLTAGDWSFATYDRAVGTDSMQRRDFDFDSFEHQAESTRAFTRAMHSVSMAPGLAWPERVDLAASQVLLDVGGGSGAHSIGACLHWPNLRAIVLDIAPVCDVAEEFIAKHRLESRITTHPADMWENPFPAADVHFYSNVLHDWLPEKGRFLIEKSYERLEPGGRVILHEALLNDDNPGPFTVAALSVAMVSATEGQQYSGRELSTMLRDAGFAAIEVVPTFGYFSVVTGLKP